MIKLKVCGMKYLENIEALSSVKPNFMGFIFYKNSKRCVDMDDLKAEELLASLNKTTKKVGVFVDELIEEITTIAQLFQFDLIQLHGNETPEFCKNLNQHYMVMKAFGIDEAFDFEKTQAYEPVCDYFLFDTKTKNHGGSGKKFDWAILNKYTGKRPFFVAGGITLKDVVHLKAIKHSQFFGVDVNSGFEIAPGLKNITNIQLFKEQLEN